MSVRATYRLQLSDAFGFDDARSIAGYLARLGVSHVYASPILAARSGSQHGYDVVDPTRIDGDRGGAAAFERLCAALRAEGMGIVVDLVPNHMAASPENPWWMDVLKHGRASRYSTFFDIAWSEQGDKVLLPVLGAPYGETLERSKLTLELGSDGFSICYEDTRFPVDPATYPRILDPVATSLEDERAAAAVRRVAREASAVPDRALGVTDDRRRRAEAVDRALWRLYGNDPAARKHIDEGIRRMNGVEGDPNSFDALDALVSAQPYRLGFWRLASREINYRRFFDITDLVGVRQEHEEVFDATHALVLELVAAGMIDGVRIDHIDGLYDPQAYLERLRDRIGGRTLLVVEKILAPGERLPEGWPVDGTTGYGFARLANGIFTDARGAARIRALGERMTGDRRSFEEVAYTEKARIITELFSGRVHTLTADLYRLALEDRHARDLTAAELSAAVTHLTASLAVYRTYLRPDETRDDDVAIIARAASLARDRVGAGQRAAVDFIERVLLDPEPSRRAFAMRWQQESAPATAKGVEDTALYAWNRLISCNEVGFSPDECAIDAATLVSELGEPRPGLNATTTHDTKRGEDVRARITMLSHIPARWERAIPRWRRLHGQTWPDPNEEIYFYQTLIGVLHTGAKVSASLIRRLQDTMVKASREAKVNTSWVSVDARHERTLRRLVRATLSSEPFVDDVRRSMESLDRAALVSSCAQLLLKVFAPGIPDLYQGTETWTDLLVDPDNRRPVQYAALATMLDEGERSSFATLWVDGDLARVKLFVTHKALAARRAHEQLFRTGSIIGLRAGPHGVALGRALDDDRWALLAFTTRPFERARFNVTLPGDAPRRWVDVLTGRSVRTGRTVSAERLFPVAPFALLVSEA